MLFCYYLLEVSSQYATDLPSTTLGHQLVWNKIDLICTVYLCNNLASGNFSYFWTRNKKSIKFGFNMAALYGYTVLLNCFAVVFCLLKVLIWLNITPDPPLGAAAKIVYLILRGMMTKILAFWPKGRSRVSSSYLMGRELVQSSIRPSKFIFDIWHRTPP